MLIEERENVMNNKNNENQQIEKGRRYVGTIRLA